MSRCNDLLVSYSRLYFWASEVKSTGYSGHLVACTHYGTDALLVQLRQTENSSEGRDYGIFWIDGIVVFSNVVFAVRNPRHRSILLILLIQLSGPFFSFIELRRRVGRLCPGERVDERRVLSRQDRAKIEDNSIAFDASDDGEAGRSQKLVERLNVASSR